MTKITLYYAPLTCARVTFVALEQTGAEYSAQVVKIFDPEQKEAYRSINPTGRVPTLQIDNFVLTENAAILYHLHQQFPDRGLLPKSSGKMGDNAALQDLIWCSSTLHPMTRMLAAPFRFTANGETEGIIQMGKEMYQPVLTTLSERFSASSFWFGNEWSIIDTYLHWNYCTAQRAGLDLSGHPDIAAHAARVSEHPAVKRVAEREAADLKSLGW